MHGFCTFYHIFSACQDDCALAKQHIYTLVRSKYTDIDANFINKITPPVFVNSLLSDFAHTVVVGARRGIAHLAISYSPLGSVVVRTVNVGFSRFLSLVSICSFTVVAKSFSSMRYSI